MTALKSKPSVLMLNTSLMIDVAYQRSRRCFFTNDRFCYDQTDIAPSLVNDPLLWLVGRYKRGVFSRFPDSETTMASSSTKTTVSNHDAQWEWEGDGGHWQQYPIPVQQNLSQAFDAGKKEVNLSAHPSSSASPFARLPGRHRHKR